MTLAAADNEFRDGAPPSRFRAWREENGLSQRDVAKLAGVSQTMVSMVERRERSLAPITRLKVAKRLRVPEDVLFDDDDQAGDE